MVLALLLLATTAGLGIYMVRSFPALDGQLQAPGLLEPVTLARDGADITHIQAQSAHDAWFSLGYVHAQERGWQLEFNRRVMHGELSEVLGESTLDTDKLLRTLGIARAAQRQWQALPAEGRDATQAYSDGVNAFYASSSQALPPEFHILGAKPGGASGQPWAPQDSLGWLMMMALDLGGNWGTEFARLTLAGELDTASLWQLFPPYPGESPASKVDLAKLYRGLGIYRSTPAATRTSARPSPARSVANSQALHDLRGTLAASVNDWACDLGSNEGKGSNNWVVDGSRTTSGKPLLANDPHLGLTAPAVWYYARLQAPAAGGEPGLDVIGATLPGLPFVVLGRTRQAAWSFTNTNPDVQDLYIEQINPANPAQYRVPSAGQTPAWADFGTRQETIRVKGRPDVTITVRETRHGPVLSDVQKSHGDLLDTSRHVLALRFTALDADNQTVLAGLRANRAQSVAAMLEAFRAYDSPMQNVVVADTAGQTAFKATGRVPLRQPANDIRGVGPSPGWDARYDWTSWLPYDQAPQAGRAAIAAAGWLATANQRITPPGYRYFIGQDWTVPYRQDRIGQLLDATPKHDVASMQRLQADVHSEAALKLLPFVQKALASTSHPLAGRVQDMVRRFDGQMRVDDTAPLILAAWADEFARGVIGGRLGDSRFRAVYGKRHFRSAVEDILVRNDTAWCGPAGCDPQSVAALDRALARLQALYGDDVNSWRWHWGHAHQALSSHRPFGNAAPLDRFFNIRVPTGGDTFTINVGQHWDVGDGRPFANRQGASMRAIYDLADLEKSLFIYQAGQSGLVFSNRYRDMSEQWAAVQYRPLQMDPPAWSHRLTLTP